MYILRHVVDLIIFYITNKYFINLTLLKIIHIKVIFFLYYLRHMYHLISKKNLKDLIINHDKFFILKIIKMQI